MTVGEVRWVELCTLCFSFRVILIPAYRTPPVRGQDRVHLSDARK
jgi:hypothetical protein